MGNGGQPLAQPQPANARAIGRSVSKGDVLTATGIAVLGAVGGFLYWVLQVLAQQSVGTNLSVKMQILAMVFVGAISGLFGVYLLTASDLKAIKTFIFAIVCGLVWQPIIESAKGLAATHAATQQAADLGSKASQIKSAAQNGSPEQVKSQVDSTAAAVKDAVATLPTVPDKDTRHQLLSQSKNAVDAIESGYSKAPAATVDALTQVGVDSAKANQGEVAATTIQSLGTVAEYAKKNGQEDIARKAYGSIQTISSQTSDPLVKDTAAGSMRDAQAAAPSR